MQQLQLRLERVEAPRQNHNEPENEDSEDEEFNPFHVNGRIQPDKFIDWIHTFERVFDYQEVREDLKVKIVAIKIKKHASV
ncbi:hypothetical protein Tco_0104745 [Tanacetum coccineum]